MSSPRERLVAVVAAALALCSVAFVLAFAPAPAHAFGKWAHGGAAGCSCHESGPVTDASCTSCHGGFASLPGRSCWSCHAPGQDTSALSTPSAACSQECHLYSKFDKAYTIPSSHGAAPHLGSSGTPGGCLDCHQTSAGVFDPGASPHHSGEASGFDACAVCHTGYQKHTGAVACATCHTQAEAFHLGTASSPGTRTCRACHAKKHAGRSVPGTKCAACHKGAGSGPAAKAQHSSSVTKRFACSTCHAKKLHARSVSRAVKSCRTCHGGKYHAAQSRPSNAVCLRCHSAARWHAVGYRCALCHKRAVHATRPSAS